MVIDFSAIGVMKEQPILILKNADGTPIQTLGYAFNLKADIRYNEVSTITFDLPAYVDGEKTPHYDDVIGMRVIDMQGWGQFILVNPETSNNGVKEVKSCKAYSLEYELTYKQTYFEEATYNFWNPLAPDNTVLGMLLADSPSWSIGHVDEELIGKYRTFSEENANVYNFIKSTVQKTYNCIFDFDTYTRKIYVRSTNSGAITKPVHISMNNLAKSIDIDEDTESIVTVLDVNGGEDVDIRMVNPLGTNKIYNLDYFMNLSHFSQSMIDKWNRWRTSYENNRLAFYNLSVEQALKTSAILTEQAKLSDIEGVQLGALLSQRAVYIEYLAQIANQSSTEYQKYQNLLNQVNAQITAKQAEVTAQKAKITVLDAEREEILNELAAIKNAVAFSQFFTDSELLVLQRYFKEDSIEDSSFVLSAVDSYSDSDISNEISNIRFQFTGGTVTKVLGLSGKDLFTVSGGKLVCTGSSASINSSVVSASFERKSSDGSFVLAVYLSNGTIGATEFPSGCISFTGTCLAPSSNVSHASNTDAYATGTTLIFTAGSGRLYFTRNTTEYEKYSVEWNLYDYGKECLDVLAYPSYSFSISSANFFMSEDFEAFVNAIELGERIYLNTGDDVLEPICIGFAIDFENKSSLSLIFSDKYSASDKAFKLVDLLDRSISMGKTLNSNKLSYSAFVDSGASTAVKQFMDAALDVAKNAVLSSTGQGISWDETGLHLRKYNNPDNPDAGFEDEQIWMINNAIVFTDDGWQTAKMAIGKIIDENLVSSDNPSGTAYGIVAPYIVGTLLAGQNLIIDTENGGFRVDASGVYIDALKFYITHGDSEYETIGDELSELEQGIIDNSNALEGAVAELNERIDGTITTYYQDEKPSNPNEGDLWFDTDDEKLYRYSNGTWELIEDADIAAAIAAAQNAQDTADGKICTYYQATNPAKSWSAADKAKNVGDIWYNTSTKTVDGCLSKKAYRWNGSAWQSLEDGSIPKLQEAVDAHEQTLSSIINENGYLKAAQLQGVINSLNTKMQSGTGNVLFDSNGLWLMNGTTKATSTKAIWMNEQGILFGSGNKSNTPETTWTWTTAIGHDGITADALASKTLSAVTIKGGEITIGGTASNPAFKVDTAGNLTANSGTFKGKLESPTLKGQLKADASTWIIGAGLSIGGNPTTSSGNFYVDTNGNVTMKGSINMSAGTITWGSGNSPVKVQYSANGSSWHTTFASTDYYARYSYDGGGTWTSAIQIKGQNGTNGTNGTNGKDGKDGRDGRDGSDANVTFSNVNSALSNLFKTWSGGTPASMSSAYIYAPDIKGGNIYGANIYAGTGSGYSQMTQTGLNVFDTNGDCKIGIGYYSSNYTYPYLILGVGSGFASSDSGMAMKFNRGLWLGTSNARTHPDANNSSPKEVSGTTGIFIDFSSAKIYQYKNGAKSEIGSGSSGGTATAVFG